MFWFFIYSVVADLFYYYNKILQKLSQPTFHKEVQNACVEACLEISREKKYCETLQIAFCKF